MEWFLHRALYRPSISLCSTLQPQTFPLSHGHHGHLRLLEFTAHVRELEISNQKLKREIVELQSLVSDLSGKLAQSDKELTDLQSRYIS